jgi:hypothetical protein
MKKLIILVLLASLTFAGFSQGLLKPVALFPTKAENNYRVSLGEAPITHKIVVRLDATIVVAEVNYNKVTKAYLPTAFSAIGPAIGFQSYIPTSATDPTPINNYGASLGLALGKTIYNPNLAEAKAVLAINIWQYFKFGGTYTFNPPTDIAKLGFFFGGGITF